MNTLLLSTVLLAGGGIGSALLRKSPERSCFLGAVTAALSILILSAEIFFFKGAALCGSVKLFILPILFVGLAAALYAPSYLMKHGREQCGRFFFFYNFTLCSMIYVVFLHKMIPFLIAWELMGLFSFFLVISDLDSGKSRRAGWIYLLACEAGGLLLMLGCMLRYKGLIQSYPLLYFILLAAGFGLKAGFVLLHVWLPRAHPAAPAPVSALMSGSMIVLGFCGLFRFLPNGLYFNMLCGWFLLSVGMLGAFYAIVCGMAQKDLKCLLAYSSVENIGIIAMGFGLGFLGLGCKIPAMTYCGFAGAALHILNHALLKGSLFLGAGTVLATAHTLNMDQLGGLMKRLPRTGTLFTLGSLGICGLPPFCAFTGELLIYLAAFHGVIHGSGMLMILSMTSAVILALTGAVACAALIKAVAGVFLGESRSVHGAEGCSGEHKGFYLPVFFLMVFAFAMPFCAVNVLRWIGGKKGNFLVEYVLDKNALFTFCILILFLMICFVRSLKKSSVRKVGTWDCGYAEPSARMEYTATAFVQPLADLLNALLHQRKTVRKPQGLFMKDAFMDVECPDGAERFFWEKIFRKAADLTAKIHIFQSGYLHLYILVMTLTVILMLCAGLLGSDMFTGGK